MNKIEPRVSEILDLFSYNWKAYHLVRLLLNKILRFHHNPDFLVRIEGDKLLDSFQYIEANLIIVLKILNWISTIIILIK